MDNVSGKVTDERYKKMSVKLETKQAGLKETVSALEQEISALEREAVNVDKVSYHGTKIHGNRGIDTRNRP